MDHFKDALPTLQAMIRKSEIHAKFFLRIEVKHDLPKLIDHFTPVGFVYFIGGHDALLACE